MCVHYESEVFHKRDFTDPAERIARLLEIWSARIATAFREAIESIKTELDLRELEVLIARGELNRVESRITAAATRVASVSGEAFVASARDTSRLLSQALTTTISFDLSNERAISLVRRNRLNLIAEFTQEQREVVRASVINSLQTGQGPRRQAQVVRDAIGLTASQNRAVDNYRALLEAGSRQALSRDLRDRRFDSTIRNARRRPLTPEQIERQVQRYRERFLAFRALNIGRFQAGVALNQARHESYRQAIESGRLDESQIQRSWNTNIDSRERLSHNILNGATVRGLSERYVTITGARLLHPIDPLGPADEVFNCRCTESFTITGAPNRT